MGFAVELIVKPPDMGNLDLLDIHCPICKDILEDPQMVPDCEHTHCKTCGEKALPDVHPEDEELESYSCPSCRTEVDSLDSLLPAPRVLRNILDKLTVKCCHSVTGCRAPPMSFSLVRAHEKACKHNPENGPKQCKKGCGFLVPKDSAASHICIAALRQELEILRSVLVDVSRTTSEGRKFVKQHQVKDIDKMLLGVDQQSERFYAVGHYWYLKYKIQELPDSEDQKVIWFSLFLACDGPTNREVSRWTVQLKSSVELRVKSLTSMAGDEDGEDDNEVQSISPERVYGPEVLADQEKVGQFWGFEKFISLDELLKADRFLAPDGSITLEVVFPANTQAVTICN